MDTHTLRIIRAMIAAGASDDVILTTLTVMLTNTVSGASSVDTPPSPERPISGTSAVRLGSPAVSRATFGKPNQTSVSYRSTVTAAKLPKYGLTGNKLAVMEYVIANGGADSRAMRSAILTHKLRPDGTNKAIESAVHALKTDGLLSVKPKPISAPAPRATPAIPGNGVELD